MAKHCIPFAWASSPSSAAASLTPIVASREAKDGRCWPVERDRASDVASEWDHDAHRGEGGGAGGASHPWLPWALVHLETPDRSPCRSWVSRRRPWSPWFRRYWCPSFGLVLYYSSHRWRPRRAHRRPWPGSGMRILKRRGGFSRFYCGFSLWFVVWLEGVCGWAWLGGFGGLEPVLVSAGQGEGACEHQRSVLAEESSKEAIGVYEVRFWRRLLYLQVSGMPESGLISFYCPISLLNHSGCSLILQFYVSTIIVWHS